MTSFDFRELLAGPICKANIDKIVDSANRNPDEFPVIWNLRDDEDIKVSWRAAWACEKLSELRPEWFISKQNELIDTLLQENHDGKKRLLLSILYNLPNPEPYSVPFLDYTLDKMFDPKESIGVQALCVKLAYRLCNIDKDLLYELKMRLQSEDLSYYSKGLKASVRNILKKIG
ncbi:hypothetical protein LJC52_02250 [Bacteroidales bacterium OttesenSCG-928-A17]|nr:hypothetical protein [Bacteroidales bacterium OttesenSCG-928-A17]